MFQEPNYYSIASTEVYVVIKKKVKFTTTALNSLTVSFIVVSFIGTIHRCSGCISEETLSTVAGLQGRVVTPTDEGTTLARDSRHYTCYTTDFHSVSPFFLILINILPTNCQFMSDNITYKGHFFCCRRSAAYYYTPEV